MKFSTEEKRLFNRNKKLFLKHFPHFSVYIESALPSNIGLFREGEDTDIIVNDVRFYGVDARVYAGQQIEKFIKRPSIIESGMPIADDSRAPTHGIMLKKFDKVYQKSSIIATVETCRLDAATAFCFGLGAGFHIYPLIIQTQCRSLVIVEPEPSFLVLSMYFIDWGKIFKILDGRLYIVVQRDAETVFRAIHQYIGENNAGAQQIMFHFKHYSSEFLDLIYKKFNEKSNLFFDGLGFYDDEKNMTKNHLLNSYCDTWKLCSMSPNHYQGTAVIVGAGPSLNNDIEWLKDNQDKVIVFSGGSALPTLLKNGIVPDFHVEIENIALNYDLLRPLTEKYDLSKTILIPSSTMDTRSARLFNRRMWFMREGVTTSFIYNIGIETLNWQNPTVVNTATSAAISCGFRNLYLLGADFGTLDPAVHHSRDSFYDFHEDLKKVEFKFPEKVSANFGGQAFTNLHYMTGLHYMNALAEQCRTAKIFNGSNGALIPRTTPVRSSRFQIQSLTVDKSQLVNHIYGQAKEVDWAEKYGKDMFDDLVNDFVDYIKILRGILSSEGRRNKDFILYLINIYRKIILIQGSEAVFNPLVKGTINYETLLMMYWWRRVVPADLKRFEKICRHQWKVFLNILEKDFIKFVNEVRQELPLVRPELFDDKGDLIAMNGPSMNHAE